MDVSQGMELTTWAKVWFSSITSTTCCEWGTPATGGGAGVGLGEGAGVGVGEGTGAGAGLGVVFEGVDDPLGAEEAPGALDDDVDGSALLFPVEPHARNVSEVATDKMRTLKPALRLIFMCQKRVATRELTSGQRELRGYGQNGCAGYGAATYFAGLRTLSTVWDRLRPASGKCLSVAKKAPQSAAWR